MIVTKENNTINLFEQHEHAKVSGDIAKHWRVDLFKGINMKDDVLFAITQHDRAWIPLDEDPIWNIEKNQPYSFMDYPMKEKTEAYIKGVDEIERKSSYAALLCSMHYTAFFDKDSTDPIISRYISREIDRQNRLKSRFERFVSDKDMQFHFNLLRFCDNLSLYICLNKPGLSKGQENKMFINGFPQQFDRIDGNIHASWHHKHTIKVSPFPFEGAFNVEIPFKRLTLNEANHFEKFYKEKDYNIRKVAIKR